jgi:transcription elongation factor Elf1
MEEMDLNDISISEKDTLTLLKDSDFLKTLKSESITCEICMTDTQDFTSLYCAHRLCSQCVINLYCSELEFSCPFCRTKIESKLNKLESIIQEAKYAKFIDVFLKSFSIPKMKVDDCNIEFILNTPNEEISPEEFFQNGPIMWIFLITMKLLSIRNNFKKKLIGKMDFINRKFIKYINRKFIKYSYYVLLLSSIRNNFKKKLIGKMDLINRKFTKYSYYLLLLSSIYEFYRLKETLNLNVF